MEKAVITGGAGFIGSHLADELAQHGYAVTIIDDLSTGKLSNIEHLIKSKEVEFIKGSITSPDLLEKTFRQSRYVFHLAAVVSVPQSIADPGKTHEVNITGTFNVLQAARRNHVSKVVFASSAAVYGDTTSPVQREDMLPNPLSPYAVSKLVGEYYCAVFNHVYNLPTVCLRYFNIYGTRQDASSGYSAVIPLFLETVSRGKSLTIFGDGERTRDFIFIKDIVAANTLFAENKATGVFNIGSGEKNSIKSLVLLIARLMGKEIKPIFKEPRPGDIAHSLADISRARSYGFQPEYKLEEGLAQVIASQRGKGS